MIDTKFVDTLTEIGNPVFIGTYPYYIFLIGINTIDTVVRNTSFIVRLILQIDQLVVFFIDDIDTTMIGCHPDKSGGILNDILNHVTC